MSVNSDERSIIQVLRPDVHILDCRKHVVLKHEPERFGRPSQNTCDSLPDFSDSVIFEYLEVSQNFPSGAKVCEDLDTPLARA